MAVALARRRRSRRARSTRRRGGRSRRSSSARRGAWRRPSATCAATSPAARWPTRRWILLHRLTGAVHSNNQTDPALRAADPRSSVGHTVVDLGDDVFTVGRPHPMIDPSTRTERIDAETGDPSIAVVLVDVVLGYGSHPDPAGALVPSLRRGARARPQARGGYLPVIASVTGTPGRLPGLRAARWRSWRPRAASSCPRTTAPPILAAKILREGGAPMSGTKSDDRSQRRARRSTLFGARAQGRQPRPRILRREPRAPAASRSSRCAGSRPRAATPRMIAALDAHRTAARSVDIEAANQEAASSILLAAKPTARRRRHGGRGHPRHDGDDLFSTPARR